MAPKTAIVYLDVEDEITSAAARIRAGEQSRVALVVPYGSRLATSRINFRLLAREAQTRGRRLAIVAGDAATRALAASAGLPAFGSVAEYEEADGEGTVGEAAVGPPPPPPLPPAADHDGSPEPEARQEPDATVRMATPLADTGARHGAADDVGAAIEPDVPPYFAPRERASQSERSIPVVRPDWRLPIGRTAAVVLVGALAFVLLVGGVAGYLLLPWASITVTAHAQPIGPVELTIRADPAAGEVDANAGVVPAERLTFDLAASDSYPASGVRVEQAAATGDVRFQSFNTGDSNTIPAGSVVSTEGGVQFRTRAAVTLPPAELVPSSPGFTVIPSEANVGVTAVKEGTAGNVPANSITVVPEGESPTLTKVTNPEATSGGRREEFPRVVQADVDAAVRDLTSRVQSQFQSIVADPVTVPEGKTLFPETATSTDPQPGVDPTTLVGNEVESFELGMTASGSVVAVDERPVEEIARTRIRERVQPEHRLVDDSIEVSPAEATVDGEIVSFSLTATARQIRILDASDLRDLVKGRTLAEARAILEPYGDVAIDRWPDWVTSVPTIDARFELSVDTDTGPGARTSPSPGRPSAPASSGPSPGASAPASPGPSATGAQAP